MTSPCTGCTHARRRIKWSQARWYCAKYHMVPEARCIDYRPRPSALAEALARFRCRVVG